MSKLTYSEVEYYSVYSAATPYFGNILSRVFVHPVNISCIRHTEHCARTCMEMLGWFQARTPRLHPISHTQIQPHRTECMKRICIFMTVHSLPGFPPQDPISPSLHVKILCILQSPIQLLVTAMVWMFVFPPNSYVEILMPNVIVLGGGTFRRCLGHEGGALMNRINALKKRPYRAP